MATNDVYLYAVPTGADVWLRAVEPASGANVTGTVSLLLDDAAVIASAVSGRWGPNVLQLDPVSALAGGVSGRSGSSSVLLDGIDISIASSSSAATSSAGGGYGPAKRRYVRKIGSRLVTFSSARAAVAAIDVSLAPAANSDPVAPDEAVKTVKVSEVKRIAASYAAEDKIMELFNRAQYEAIMMMVEDWQRDEEDVELLLMSV